MFNAIDLRQVDLNLLVVFSAVLRERSVKRAAERLLVGQSAVSMALGRLRELFRDELFVKVATGVEPTSKALALEPQVSAALELLHRALYESEPFDPAKSSRVVRLALSDDLEVWLLPALLAAVQRAAPGVTLATRPSSWYTGIQLLERGEVDIACGILPKPGAALFAEQLFEESFVSLFDPEHIQPPLSLAQFLATPHAMMSVSGDLIGLVDEALAAQGKSRRLVATSSSFAALGQLVRGRALIATLPRTAAEQLAAALALATAKAPVPIGPYPVSMLWHAKSDADPTLRWLRVLLRQVVRERVPRSRDTTRHTARRRRSRRVRTAGTAR